MVFIRQIKLPLDVRGFTAPDNDGNYNIYINEDLCEEAKNKTLKHELEHIKHNHFYSDQDAQFLEEEAEFFCG